MPSAAARTTNQTVQDLLQSPSIQSAFRFFDDHASQITDEQIRICSIAAPPFGESERARYLCAKFRGLGLVDSAIDREGNCIALRRGKTLSPLLVVSAHLDSVFPAETDVSVRRENGRLFAPGISDDCCGLAAVIAIAQALDKERIETSGSILFVGTVGEEGEGNLRGVRYLLSESEWANKVDAFVSFDGAGIDRVTNGALGSRRYQIKITGPGGHSWTDFGFANPVHALARAIARLVSYPAPKEPRSSFNVGRVQGGVSVNAIPREASMDVDLRSVSDEELQRLDAFFRRAVNEAVADENANRREESLPARLDLKLIGDRPSGVTHADAPLVQLALEATRAVGIEPQLETNSTDSNFPISIGVPALTLGAGGTAQNVHTLEEWYDPEGREQALKRGLLFILGVVSLAEA